MHLCGVALQTLSLDVFLVYASLLKFLRALHRSVFEQPALAGSFSTAFKGTIRRPFFVFGCRETTAWETTTPGKWRI